MIAVVPRSGISHDVDPEHTDYKGRPKPGRWTVCGLNLDELERWIPAEGEATCERCQSINAKGAAA